MKKVTKDEWKKFVSKNCGDSYSLVVCLAVLILLEAGARTEEEARPHIQGMGLSGAQAEMAMGYAFAADAEDWLDEIGKKLRRPAPTA